MSEEEKTGPNTEKSADGAPSQRIDDHTDENKNRSQAINTDQVIAFLKDNPDFFKTHTQLMATLNFTHETGGAVSLIQRQVERLREHHQVMRTRLLELTGFAEKNETLLTRIRMLTLATASANTPKAILENLTRVITQDFGLDSVYLVVEHKNWPLDNQNIIELTPEDLGKLRSAIHNLPVFVGRPPAEVKEMVLRDKGSDTASIAMARFEYRGVDTYLITGSRDRDHFTSDMGTDFVAYIGDYLQALLSR